MSQCISPCAFIGEFDQELGTTIIYAFEYYRLNHLCDCSQHPQRCTYPLCVAHFVRGTCCVTNNIISGAVQEREERMLIHIASRLLNSHNSSQELIVMQDDELFAIAGITFTLPDILARGEVRHFCIFVLHHSFSVLMSQWSIINMYLRCLILQWQIIASSRRLYECNHVGNIEERREAAHRSALRHFLELIATTDHTNTNEIDKNNTDKEKNENDKESDNDDYINFNTNEQSTMDFITYAGIHGFFEYVMPIFFTCTYRSSSSSNTVGNALNRSFEPQLPLYHKLLQTSSLNISS